MIDVRAENVSIPERRYSRYQTALLRQLAMLWQDHKRILDIGGGNGTIAQAIHDILAAEVTSIDVVNRFRRDLTIKTAVYDGMTLPFADGIFDAITLNNVIHHVPRENRARLIQECARVCTGPLYVKDHLAVRGFDHVRLFAMDAIGNLPHGGMVRAKYLSAAEWDELRGNRTEERIRGGYRSGLHAALFPNRLEIFMKWSHR